VLKVLQLALLDATVWINPQATDNIEVQIIKKYITTVLKRNSKLILPA
jgi:hypothetical protein